MGVRILTEHDDDGGCSRAVLYCSTTDWAFGPVCESYEEAQKFLKWLPEDARSYGDVLLGDLYHSYRVEATEQVQCPTCKGTGVCPTWEEDYGFEAGCDTCDGRQTISKAQVVIGGYDVAK